MPTKTAVSGVSDGWLGDVDERETGTVDEEDLLTNVVNKRSSSDEPPVRFDPDHPFFTHEPADASEETVSATDVDEHVYEK